MKPSQADRAELVARMRNARLISGLTYASLAERANLDPGQVSRICRGEFVTFSDSVVRICTVLNVPLRHEDPPVAPPAQTSSQAWAKLERSVRRAWDETPAGADKLAKVIAAVAEMSRR